MAIESSWNPALRPNTSFDAKPIAQLETRENIPPIQSLLEEEAYLPNYDDDPSTESERRIDTVRPKTPETLHAIQVQTPQHDNNELENLRDALKTSLASPGGVELEESPVHNEDQDGAHSVSMASPEILEKANFPSKGPAHEPGHSSAESFSRTVSHVSQEVSWGEDDEVDPEWNLHRTETDPFKFMGPSDRTNSFPAVKPIQHTPAKPEEPLVHTQAESVMMGLEETEEDKDFFNQGVNDYEAIGSPGFSEGENEQDSYKDYGKSYGGNLGEQDVGARFEEGLPLVPHPDGDDDNFGSSQMPEPSPFGDDGIDEEEDFFNQSGAKPEEDSSKAIGSPKLERKSTMQVMGSLQFQPLEQTVEISAPRDMDDPSGPLKPADDVANVMEESAPEDPDAQFFEGKVESAREPSEDDLAAKWQAELGEDLLLEDDEFLPDDEPELREADPSAFFGSDDEGFLADPEETEQVTRPQQNTIGGSVVQHTGSPQQSQPNRYLPSGASQNAPQQQNSNPYSPAAPSFANLSNNRPGLTSYASAPYSYGAPNAPNNIGGSPLSFGQQQPQRPKIPGAQSFADKAKGGYSSPYDLPIDLKPKKRASLQQMTRGYSNQQTSNIPPPRSSSMNPQLPPPSRGSASSMSPPTSSHSYQQFPGQQPRMPVPPPIQTAPPTLKSKGSFFEELPMASRPRPAGRYTPQPSQPSPSMPPGYVPAPSNVPPQGQRPPPVHSYTTPSQYPVPVSDPGQNLVAPAKVNPYAPIQNGMAPHVPQVPSTAQRYSPALAQPRNTSAPPGPPAAAPSRYSPAPHQPPTAYVPRTSSPLAHFSESSHGASGAPLGRSFSHEASVRMAQTLPATQEIDENQEYVHNYQGQMAQVPISPTQRITSPPMHSARSNMPLPKRSNSNNYDPVSQVQTSPQKSFVPPPRAQTQSPGAVSRGLRLESAEPHQRPGSVHSPSSSYSASAFQSMTSNTLNVARTRPLSQSKNYIPPTDGREHDPLQRWKGCPIFSWGVGGSVITSFPVEVPRYSQGRTAPMYICSPGEVKVRNVKDVLPLQQRLASFPGPLKGKSKKKDVVSWLSAGIEILEKEYEYLPSLPTLSHEDKRNEERILLWKILRVFIENDGILEGNPAVVDAVRSILSPALSLQSDGAQPLYATGADLSGIAPSANSQLRAEPVNPAAVDELRKHLLRGDRTKAVWEAVDKRLWAHAMLISNTVSKELYKQVAQEFVREEVKNTGENTESLAALYEIFAGNFEESIDELVAPSARAGFQMVSTTRPDAGPSKSALDGLDRWRETLGLVLSNRSTDDSHALNALGKLLSGYGRAEAAHICFLFARSISVFGGFDDPSSSIVLIGADHLRQPNGFAKELEPILLSEVYEYGSSLSSTSHIGGSAPHLAVYKLQHAKMLAEYGLREKAISYCDAILASITSQTKRSPYHHTLLLNSLDDLTKRLKASPKDESNSWISKPSIEKVSGSVWSTFNKFVAGEDNGGSVAAPGADGSTEVGPFARIAGGTPTISRSASQADIYNTYNGGLPTMGGVPIPGVNRAASRYAPGASYTPPAAGQDQTSSSYGSQTRQSFEQLPRSSDELRRGPYEPVRQSSEYTRPSSQAGSITNGYMPLSQLRQPLQHSQNPYASVADSPYSGSTSSLQQNSPYPSTPNTGIAPAQNTYGSPEAISQPTNAYEPIHPSASFEPPEPATESQPDSGYQPYSSNTGYEPPVSSGYEPPSYNTSYEPEPDSPVDTRPKKKSFMDDDDDDNYSPAVSAKPREKTKAEIDREVDEAFRKAAEEDAKKDAEKPAKKGWGLTTWFGGGKKDTSQDMSQPNKPIKAKLGDESSFYYDPDLKRWINKKDPAAAKEKSSATPPPPKGLSRMSSTSGAPPMSRSGSSASFNAPPAAPSMMERSLSSRTTDSEITSSSLTERPEVKKQDSMMGLRAPPASFQRSVSNGSVAGAGAGPGTAPPSRPATGMSNASSLDDLLGPAVGGSRRGAGGKAKKKGRYVDVFPTGGAAAGS